MTDDKTVIAEPGSFSDFGSNNKKRHACLVQYSGAGLGKRYMLDGSEVSIGRSPNANIYLNEQSVSRDHARFHLRESSVEVEDKGSSNGTYVNDERISTKVSLRDGDIIRLGTILLKYFDSNNIDGIIQDKIYRMATIDVLTQVFNRQYLFEALTSEFRVSQSYNSPLSIIYYDLDHFKKVNDTYGHTPGDEILKTSCNIVKKVIRKDDIFGRVGGEEFVVVLPRTNREAASELAEKIRCAHEGYVFRLEYEDNGTKKVINHKQTISAGVAQFSVEMSQPEELIDIADKKLYMSKETGRNRVTV
ncbi:MAG: GGDEF domain-containing protein [Bdellovibrionota bacterium]